MSLEDRFWTKVTKTCNETCWEWTGARIPDGYGQMFNPDGSTLAHRISYEIHRGHIPEGLTLDHLCRNRWCVNPWHLDAVSNAENVRRGKAGFTNRRKTHCKQGHPFSPDNTGRYGRKRYCKTCRVFWKTKHRERVCTPR